ncbi:unnamed protein product [Clonostachys chloroleuca]|uniref:FAD-binding domain-containing protein n=1 Tax=Clonostachys chloroleuca TaxID=1926264 RepID=A0AA35PZG0_9HYPO|nr:unnamed protein product [Clonostachys chloroleuca]
MAENNVDVLIVGAGPAGLMLATWLAKCGVKTRIVDKRGTKVIMHASLAYICFTVPVDDCESQIDSNSDQENAIVLNIKEFITQHPGRYESFSTAIYGALMDSAKFCSPDRTNTADSLLGKVRKFKPEITIEAGTKLLRNTVILFQSLNRIFYWSTSLKITAGTVVVIVGYQIVIQSRIADQDTTLPDLINTKLKLVKKSGSKAIEYFMGQADGLQCRTLEILDSFGIRHRAWMESNHMLEICLWNPGSNGVIHRSSRLPDTIPGISRFQQVVLRQGRIERFFLDAINEFSSGGIEVERGVLPTSLDIDQSCVEDPDAYPITVNLRHLSEEEATPKQSNGSSTQDGLFRSNLMADDTADMLKASELDQKANSTETIKAKYMVGADGAHSWAIGLKLEGESTDYIWVNP